MNELKDRNIPFIYYTMDINDRALDMVDYADPNFPVDRFLVKYIGKSNKAYSFMSNIKESILITTTPHIGTPGYPIKKSKSIKNLIHFFHATGGLAGYMKNSLDFYDSVILSHQMYEKDIRVLEEKELLNLRKFILVGSHILTI